MEFGHQEGAVQDAQNTTAKISLDHFTKYQKFIIALLAFLQFTIILDFMIMSPLGALLMPALQMNPSQFGAVVSAYAFSAGISGLLAAGFADKYDRKKILIFFYAGFVLGTLLCGLATSYYFLLTARIITGLFGGVIGSIVFAITTDLFAVHQRGRVMGVVQTAFAASQILGLPAGLYFSNLWGWHAPFMMIVLVSLIAGVFIFVFMKPIDAHLKMHPDKSALHHFQTTITNKKYLFAFAATALLSLGGYMLMPFGSAYSVNNLGISADKLPIIYLITGLFSMFIGPLVGRASDRFGSFKVFSFGCVMTILLVFIYTHLGVTPIAWVIVVNTVMFIGIFSRMIPAQSLMTRIPDPASRGSFSSVSSSLQQFAGGIGSLIAGLIVVQEANGKIQNFDIVGFVIMASTIVTFFMISKIYKTAKYIE